MLVHADVKLRTDVGQVDGAFVMGVGNLLSEKLIYDEDTGKLLTHNTLGPPDLAIWSGNRTMYRQNLPVYGHDWCMLKGIYIWTRLHRNVVVSTGAHTQLRTVDFGGGGKI